MFQKDKDYRFSLKKYLEDCTTNNRPIGEWVEQVNGCRVVPSEDLSYGKWAGFLKKPLGIDLMTGQQVFEKEPMAYKFDFEWCEEV